MHGDARFPPSMLDEANGDDESEGARLLRLIAAVRELRAEALLFERTHAQKLQNVHPEHALGARNLIHYLAVRQRDIRDLQVDLAELGLSSLGRMERSVVETLTRVEHALHCLRGEPPERPFAEGLPRDLEGERLLTHHTHALLGPAPGPRRSEPAHATLRCQEEEAGRGSRGSHPARHRALGCGAGA